MNKRLQKIYRDIKTIKIQGATAVTKSVILALRQYGLEIKTNSPKLWHKELTKAADYLLSARPTEPMAQNSVKYIFKNIKIKKTSNVDQLKSSLNSECQETALIIENAAKKIIPLGKKILKNYDEVLTHCHSWLVEQMLIDAHKNGIKFKVYNTETRPLFQGRITSKKLLEANIDTTMITDSSVGFFISHYSGKNYLKHVIIIGADAILPNGSVVNKIGSYGIAAVAFLKKIPLYVAAPLFKFHHHSWIKLEKRSPGEVWSNAPKKLKIINFAFDMVPSKWIKGIICENGIIKPKDVKKNVRKIYPEIL